LAIRSANRCNFSVDHFVIDDTNEELLHGSSAKAIEDLPDSVGSQALRRHDARVHVGPLAQPPLNVALLFQAIQDGTSGTP
jgi:hypothetical protein